MLVNVPNSPFLTEQLSACSTPPCVEATPRHASTGGTTRLIDIGKERAQYGTRYDKKRSKINGLERYVVISKIVHRRSRLLLRGLLTTWSVILSSALTTALPATATTATTTTATALLLTR